MAKKITFSLAPEIVADATEGLLLGDFNNWIHEAGIKLKKQKDGSLKATVNLEPGIYQYRYFLNDGRWVNDGNASGYSFVGEYGVDNCVINVPFEEVKETLAKGELVTDIEAKPKKETTKKVATAKPAAKAEAPAKKVAAPKTAKAAAPKATAKKVAVKAEAPAKKTAKKSK
ncbi:MAG: isoamylase early set domain-containing protein [Chitinophagaceae bacterium]|nr:isoamylase early set domain-containing protein [Chitinophagaceae bacterium]